MAENRFKKSVDLATSNTMDNISDNILDNVLDNSNIIDVPNIDVNILSNILENISSADKRSRGGNHTFYLSAEVGEALGKLSKKTRQSKSALVNGILKAVFAESPKSVN